MVVKKQLFFLVGFALLALPVWADGVIPNGVDVWQTVAKATQVDFARDPIPAGFFCSGSAPFTDRVRFRGVPVATDPVGALGNADTVIHRVDDAVFDRTGVATTRLRLVALSLTSMEPLVTSCGTSWNLHATLAPGEQPTTEMRIFRDRKGGGHYEAPLLINVRLSFTRADAPTGEVLEIDREFSLRPIPGALWTSKPLEKVVRVDGYVRVDTDGDQIPDLSLPGTSDFYPEGRSEIQSKGTYYGPCEEIPPNAFCHEDPMGCHCITTVGY